MSIDSHVSVEVRPRPRINISMDWLPSRSGIALLHAWRGRSRYCDWGGETTSTCLVQDSFFLFFARLPLARGAPWKILLRRRTSSNGRPKSREREDTRQGAHRIGARSAQRKDPARRFAKSKRHIPSPFRGSIRLYQHPITPSTTQRDNTSSYTPHLQHAHLGFVGGPCRICVVFGVRRGAR